MDRFVDVSIKIDAEVSFLVGCEFSWGLVVVPIDSSYQTVGKLVLQLCIQLLDVLDWIWDFALLVAYAVEFLSIEITLHDCTPLVFHDFESPVVYQHIPHGLEMALGIQNQKPVTLVVGVESSNNAANIVFWSHLRILSL